MSEAVLYLLAGNGGAADWWEDALPHFSRYRAVPLELPGFGDNPLPPRPDLSTYAQTLIEQTKEGSAIFAVGVNALLVLHALQRKPGHFSRTVLLAPVGAFLWQRKLPRLMSLWPVRKLVHWMLCYRPHWFARQFSAQSWTTAQYRRMGRGYRRCRAFMPYWSLVRAHCALPLLEWITDPIELVWGARDAVLNQAQAAAWSAILARANLTVSIQSSWGHYPWIDQPKAFVAWLESGDVGFVAHSKGGRLALAHLAGLPVPAALSVSTAHDPRLAAFLQRQTGVLAVRSSSCAEDQADAAHAGLSTTWLRQSASDVPAKVAALQADGVEEIVVQKFIEPRISGIAFVRNLSVELEWVDGHLEALASGLCQPRRATLSRLGGDWSEGSFGSARGLSERHLWRFLQSVLRAFHYVHADVEWAWDGQQLWLLQIRPISDYGWRRHLTAANIAEILPPQRLRRFRFPSPAHREWGSRLAGERQG